MSLLQDKQKPFTIFSVIMLYILSIVALTHPEQYSLQKLYFCTMFCDEKLMIGLSFGDSVEYKPSI